MKRDAVIYLKDILEATRNIPKFYFGIKYEIGWDTIKSKLPELKLKISKIIEAIKGGKV